MSTDRPRILISRLSAIGDVLHGVPVLNALRHAFPDAFLAWVVEGYNGELLRGHPSLDELIVVPRRWIKSPQTVMEIRRRLLALRCDTSIDLQGLTKSAFAGWLSGAKRRIGFGGTDGRELSQMFNNDRLSPKRTHVIDRNLELLGKLGIDSPQVQFHLPETPADACMATELIARSQYHRGYAVINPGAGWPSKVWLRERFAAVARHLGQTHSLPTLVVWGGKQERHWAEEIAAAAGSFAAVAPPTTLTELAALTRRATLFVGSDTGPLHLAVAVGTPSVGLFGPVSAQRNGPYGAEHVAVQKMCLTGSSRSRRSAGSESMAAIHVEHVCSAIDQMLQNRNKRCA